MSGVQLPQQRQRDDALTTVMKGLSIAKDIYGIKVASAQLDAEKQKIADTQQGVLNPEQRAEMLSKNFQEVPQGTAGALPFFVRNADGGKSPIFMATKQQPKDIVAVAVTNPDGSQTTKFVEKKSGLEVPTGPKKLEKIDTVDQNGNQVTQFVSPKEGSTFAREDKPNDTQLKAATYVKRASAADKIVNDLISNGYDPSSLWKVKNSLPLVGNAISSKDDQLFAQAQNDFVSAVLRPESGAAISDKEREAEKVKYFPQPGDSPQVIAQKADARQREIAGLMAQAGKSVGKVADIPVGRQQGASASWGEAIAAPSGKTDPQVAKYAKDHGLDYSTSRSILTGRGYKPND